MHVPSPADEPEQRSGIGAGSAEPFTTVTGSSATTIVVVPSLTLHPDELRKIPGAVKFEHRLLFMLRYLREPHVRVVYVTSQEIDSAILNYTTRMMPEITAVDVRDRVTFLSCNDDSSVPLTEKILHRPDMLARVRGLVPDPFGSCLVTYNSTARESELAAELGVPLHGCDPKLAHLGTKSGGRKLLRDAGVPVPDGFEDVCSEHDIVKALVELTTRNPGLKKAVVKLNDSFAGAGNVMVDVAEPPSCDIGIWMSQRVIDALPEAFREQIAVMGAVVECFEEAEFVRSPSVQLDIGPNGAAEILSTHDQLLGGPSGFTFVGCVFPAAEAYRPHIMRLASQVGRTLSDCGVTGQVSVDFIVASTNRQLTAKALEINLRMGGATAPFMFFDAVVGGTYDDETGAYRSRSGKIRCYRASDRLQLDVLRGRTVDEMTDVAALAELRYSAEDESGVVFFALGALGDYGKLGVVAVGESDKDAARRYDAAVAALESLGTAVQASGLA